MVTRFGIETDVLKTSVLLILNFINFSLHYSKITIDVFL